jgi:hypothetical protein
MGFIKKWFIDESSIGILVNETGEGINGLGFKSASTASKIEYYLTSGIIRSIINTLWWAVGFLIVGFIVAVVNWIAHSDAEMLEMKKQFLELTGFELTFIYFILFKALSMAVTILLFAIPFKIIRTIASLIYFRKSFNKLG